MKIAFQMDPMESLKFAGDSSWQLMIEGSNRGKIYHYTPKDLSWNDGELLALARQVHIKDKAYKLDDPKIINLAEMDVIFIRQDPPYDMGYLTTTYLLEKIANQVLIINNPKAIRDFPEKISVLDYQELLPPSLITYSYKEAVAFAKNYEKVIVKPLYSFAGSDVFCLEFDDINLANVIENLIRIYQAPVIIQKFIPEVSLGDKRVILIEGEPVGAFIRRPKDGDVRANLACGGKAYPTELTKREIEICQTIKPMLVKNGLFLVGVDIIAGYLTEINITSPTGLVQVQEYCNPEITKVIWDLITNKVSLK